MNSDAGTSTSTNTSSLHPTGECLSAYTDAELGRVRRAVIERHLRACERCAREVLGYREVGRILRRVPPQPLPPTRGRALPWERAAGTGPSTALDRDASGERYQRTRGGAALRERGLQLCQRGPGRRAPAHPRTSDSANVSGRQRRAAYPL